jgi:hypothetical protein
MCTGRELEGLRLLVIAERESSTFKRTFNMVGQSQDQRHEKQSDLV